MNDATVPPLFEREPDSVPGPFYVVKGQCLICDLPNQVAPENFFWDEAYKARGCQGCPNHCRVERQPETPLELALMIEAAAGSCVEAIRYCGTDPAVLARLQAEGKAHLCDALARTKCDS
jgi:hypothetical protein